MRLEYFQLIDRIVELDLAQQTIRAEARVPAESTIFEGHFPGYPLMPGVLLIEAMAQTSGWLVIAVTNFTRMPFFAALKEAKLRIVHHARSEAVALGQAAARRLRLRRHQGRHPLRRQARLQCRDHLPAGRVSQPRIPREHGEDGRNPRISEGSAGPWLMRRAKPGSPASASCPASAKAREAHWQALDGATPQRRRRDLCSLSRPSARAGQSRPANPQKGRPAPDGSLAADRHLRRRACARRMRA